MLAGRKLNSLFSETDEVNVDVYTVRRKTETHYDTANRKNVEKHHYWFKIRH
jgi:hypothetical protein